MTTISVDALVWSQQCTRTPIDMLITVLTEEDVGRYRALMLEAYAQAPDAFTSTLDERAAEPLSWWARRIAGANGMTAVFGAFEGQELIGTVAVEFSERPKTRHKAHLLGMYVKPTVRGLGTGRKLVEAVLDYLRRRPGIASVGLTVTEGNKSATKLYLRAGFVEFGTEPMAILTPSGYKAKVHMWRAIVQPTHLDPDEKIPTEA